jgi:hypothetical protein
MRYRFVEVPARAGRMLLLSAEPRDFRHET